MEQYLKTIEQPFIVEIIDERFDNISTMLTDNAVVYGSSITSIISGLPANGDLDIAVSHFEFMKLCKRFANSSKWKQIAGNTISETDFSRKEFRSKSPNRGKWHPPRAVGYHVPPPQFKKSSLDKSKKSYRNVSDVVAFETVGNKHVQIIQAMEKTDDPLSDALSIVRAVDFIFCGVAIDRHGKIFEVIKSALDDCKNRIIRVANYHSKLTERFRKYTKRGWSLGISIDQANQNYLKQRKSNKVKQQSSKIYTKIMLGQDGNVNLRFFPSMLKKLTPDELHSLIISTARKDFGIYLKKISADPMVYTEDRARKIKGRYLGSRSAAALCEKIVFKLKLRSSVKKKKKFRHHDDYEKASSFAVTTPAESTINPLNESAVLVNRHTLGQDSPPIIDIGNSGQDLSIKSLSSDRFRGIRLKMDAAPPNESIKPGKEIKGVISDVKIYDQARWSLDEEVTEKKIVVKKGGSNE
ncbi:MAG: hypothetical protein E3J47_05880 [Candidatus Stahlbacteria bacterium]|nr:MAG: hypothetical protein E3J47_05880 [Candidatus Stahlbacteria bacterium]